MKRFFCINIVLNPRTQANTKISSASIAGFVVLDSQTQQVAMLPLDVSIKALLSHSIANLDILTPIHNCITLNQLKGTQNSIDKFPLSDIHFKPIKNYGHFILGRYDNGDDVNPTFKIISSHGIIQVLTQKEIIQRKLTLANAKVNTSSKTSYISGILSTIPKIPPLTQHMDQKNKPEKVAPPKPVPTKPSYLAGQYPTPNFTRKDKQQPVENVSKEKPKMETNNPKLNRMKELVPLLKEAARVYEQENREIMSNFEYDALYDELVQLEEETGIILSGSVTQKVGYEVSSKLEKVTHPSKMLSLDKTKEVGKLESFLGDQEGTLSWKLDGLTVVATYQDGKLVSAVTRGSGTVGEKITENYKTFTNIPLTVATQERLVIRGEAVIRYSTFEKINAKITDVDAKYKNPRNLCSGSVRQLDAKITAQRSVEFYPFTVVEGFDSLPTKSAKLDKLKELGFQVVDYVKVNKNNVAKAVKHYSELIKTYDIPSDGLVLVFDDIAYSHSLGTTSKFPKDGIAYKWQDEVKETTLLDIEWSASRTGAINPVAIFEPVELEGTTVTRASLHNLSIIEQLKLGIGDKILTFKANMIIPQVAESVTKSNNVKPPTTCPICTEPTTIVQEKGSKVLMCLNPGCLAKQTGLLVHYASRDAMNIDGLSDSTVEKLIGIGVLKHLSDLYNLPAHKDKIVTLEGFGEKSYTKLVAAIDKAKQVDMANFIYALGIPQVGRSVSKDICKHYNYDLKAILDAQYAELVTIEGIGDNIATEYVTYMKNQHHRDDINRIIPHLQFKAAPVVNTSSAIAGKTFVVTGSVEIFANRKEIQAKIEALGGKCSGSVSAKTDYLINNDVTSTSGKNKSAQDINAKAGREVVKIISEKDFLALIG